VADSRGLVCPNSGGLWPNWIQRPAVGTRSGGSGEDYSGRSRRWCCPCGSIGGATCGVPKLDAQLLTRCFLAELGGSSVFVDHAAEDSMASDRGAEWDHGGGVVGWWVLAQALVRAVVIEMAHILVEHGEGMSLVVDQQSVGALFADAANEPFGVAICPGSPGRDLDHLDAFGGEHRIEGGGELGVPVTDQEFTPSAWPSRFISRLRAWL
jgi:hypothetical protein